MREVTLGNDFLAGQLCRVIPVTTLSFRRSLWGNRLIEVDIGGDDRRELKSASNAQRVPLQMLKFTLSQWRIRLDTFEEV